MSEAEFELLLDAVRVAVAPAPSESPTRSTFAFDPSRIAANDNEQAWPIIPFPDDWYATC